MNGKLIVVEGLDGSGKATQSHTLYETLKQAAQPVRQVSFPDYQSDSSALVKMYLNGAFGSDPNAVNPYAASSFYAVDRYASYMKDWKSFYADGGIIIADRYTTSNAIHQCAKLPEAEWADFIKWLFHYEYELLGIPAPDQTIYLRVDTAVSRKLLAKRYDGDAAKMDIHEANAEYLNRARQAADYCAQHLSWHIVECVQQDQMRPAADIAREILDIVTNTH